MNFSSLAPSAALLLGVFVATAALAAEPQATIADLDARLAKIGTPKIDGSDKAGDRTVPALFFGEQLSRLWFPPT